ncbi:hypothetical protein HYW44_05135 [Candidatus Daviesbacteria bacterium]|nr:hypothetical protein [Candidatus Daviesbacteria bacterium]
MRSFQRGISTLIILSIFLTAAIAIASGYFIFYQNQQKANLFPSESKTINSFEDCQKAGYPATKSYPATCSTPDGKHFIQELSEEEKEGLKPPKDNLE